MPRRLGATCRCRSDSSDWVSYDRQLQVQLEVLVAMREWPSDPGFESRKIIRYVMAARQPIAVKPLERAQFQVDPAANFNFRHGHRRESEPSNIPFRCKRL